eukprot:CAMPEP_0198203374 /NCGR_PEP_ID=MMETSP1445-20131203/6652_1 /TAXON_ID=36898 /ORGANISM="Pyramimonas sp., Strain CCMP2087" /LENGTH=296 /DNA_ID=CAMNT_0043874743 /DNA_START=280 /DNA_END=1170 /DNA_ORIENTATION=-
MILTGLYAITCMFNLYVASFHISNALQHVVRAASPMSTLLVGLLAFGREYSAAQIVGVALITAGSLTTISAEASWLVADGAETTDLSRTGVILSFVRELQINASLQWWTLGVVLLNLNMICTSFLTQMQTRGFDRWGKQQWRDMMLLQHVLSFPIFLPFVPLLRATAAQFSASAPLMSPTSFIDHAGKAGASSIVAEWLSPIASTPWAWALTAFDSVTQVACISSVHVLLARYGGVETTIVLTLRKFLSLGVSVLLFDAVFTTSHWIGVALVFIGTLIFTFYPTHKATGVDSKKKN